MNRPSEIMWLHVVRVVSIFLVLCVHSVAEVFFLGAKFGSYAWWVADIYDSAFRICVPMLFMVTGYLLLQGSEPIGPFLKKRARKVLVPLVVWTAFFLLWIHFYENAHPSPASSMTPDYMQKIVQKGWSAAIWALWSPMYYHLWFLYSILGVYLVMPLLRILVQHAQPHHLWYFVFLSVFGNFAAASNVWLTGMRSAIDLHFVSGAAGALVLGHLLGNMALSRRLFLRMALLWLASLVVTIAGTYFFTARNNGELSQAMWGDSLNVMAMSVGAFVCIRYLCEGREGLQQPGFFRTAVKTLSAASFGIYLVHVMFIYGFAEGAFGFRLTAFSGDPALFAPLLALLTFACSFAVIYVMQKLPVVRHAVP